MQEVTGPGLNAPKTAENGIAWKRPELNNYKFVMGSFRWYKVCPGCWLVKECVAGRKS